MINQTARLVTLSALVFTARADCLAQGLHLPPERVELSHLVGTVRACKDHERDTSAPHMALPDRARGSPKRAVNRYTAFMAADRMFHVLVLGGIGLVGAACASTVETRGSEGAGGFPNEGPPIQDVDAGTDAPEVVDAGMDAFPIEGPVMVDSGFPDETDLSIDASAEAGPSDDAGFPQEAPK